MKSPEHNSSPQTYSTPYPRRALAAAILLGVGLVTGACRSDSGTDGNTPTKVAKPPVAANAFKPCVSNLEVPARASSVTAKPLRLVHGANGAIEGIPPPVSDSARSEVAAAMVRIISDGHPSTGWVTTIKNTEGKSVRVVVATAHGVNLTNPGKTFISDSENHIAKPVTGCTLVGPSQFVNRKDKLSEPDIAVFTTSRPVGGKPLDLASASVAAAHSERGDGITFFGLGNDDSGELPDIHKPKQFGGIILGGETSKYGLTALTGIDPNAVAHGASRAGDSGGIGIILTDKGRPVVDSTIYVGVDTGGEANSQLASEYNVTIDGLPDKNLSPDPAALNPNNLLRVALQGLSQTLGAHTK